MGEIWNTRKVKGQGYPSTPMDQAYQDNYHSDKGAAMDKARELPRTLKGSMILKSLVEL